MGLFSFLTEIKEDKRKEKEYSTQVDMWETQYRILRQIIKKFGRDFSLYTDYEALKSADITDEELYMQIGQEAFRGFMILSNCICINQRIKETKKMYQRAIETNNSNLAGMCKRSIQSSLDEIAIDYANYVHWFVTKRESYMDQILTLNQYSGKNYNLIDIVRMMLQYFDCHSYKDIEQKISPQGLTTYVKDWAYTDIAKIIEKCAYITQKYAAQPQAYNLKHTPFITGKNYDPYDNDHPYFEVCLERYPDKQEELLYSQKIAQCSRVYPIQLIFNELELPPEIQTDPLFVNKKTGVKILGIDINDYDGITFEEYMAYDFSKDLDYHKIIT